MSVVDQVLKKRLGKDRDSSSTPSKLSKTDPRMYRDEFVEYVVSEATAATEILKRRMFEKLKNGIPFGVWEPSDSPVVHMLQSLYAQVETLYAMELFQSSPQSHFAQYLENTYELTYWSLRDTIAKHIEWARKQHEAHRPSNLTDNLPSLPRLYEWDVDDVKLPEIGPGTEAGGEMSLTEAYERAVLLLILNNSIGSETLGQDVAALVPEVQKVAQQFEEVTKAMTDAELRKRLPDKPELWTQYGNTDTEHALLLEKLRQLVTSGPTTAANVGATLSTGAPPGLSYIGTDSKWSGTGPMDSFAAEDARFAEWGVTMGKYHASWVYNKPEEATVAAVPLALGVVGCAAPVVIAAHLTASAWAHVKDTGLQKPAGGVATFAGIRTAQYTGGSTPIGKQFYALDRCAMAADDIAGGTSFGSLVQQAHAANAGTQEWWWGATSDRAKDELVRVVEAHVATVGEAKRSEKIGKLIDKAKECINDPSVAQDIRNAAGTTVAGEKDSVARTMAAELWSDAAYDAVGAARVPPTKSVSYRAKLGGALIVAGQLAGKLVFDYKRRYSPDRARLYLYNNHPDAKAAQAIATSGNNNELTKTSSQIALQAATINMLSVLHGERKTKRPDGKWVSKWLKEQKKERDNETREWNEVYTQIKVTEPDPVLQQPYSRQWRSNYNNRLFEWAATVTVLVKKLQERRTLLEQQFGIGDGVNFESILTFTKIRGSEEWKTIKNGVRGKEQLSSGTLTTHIRDSNANFQSTSVSNQFYALYRLMDALMNRAMGLYDQTVALKMENLVNLIDELNDVYMMIDDHKLLGNTDGDKEDRNRVRDRLSPDSSMMLAWHVQPLPFETDDTSAQAFARLKRLFNKYLEPRETFNHLGEVNEFYPWKSANQRSEANFREDEVAAEAAAEAAGNANAPYDGPARGTRRQRREEARRQAEDVQAGIAPEQNADGLLQLVANVPNVFQDAGINPNQILENGFFWAPLQADGAGIHASVVDEVYARVSALRL